MDSQRIEEWRYKVATELGYPDLIALAVSELSEARCSLSDLRKYIEQGATLAQALKLIFPLDYEIPEEPKSLEFTQEDMDNLLFEPEPI